VGRIDEIANRYVDKWAPLSPTGATYVGIAGHDNKLDDLSPDGYRARADLTRATLTELEAAEPDTEAERTAKEAMQERLGLDLARYEAGETTSEFLTYLRATGAWTASTAQVQSKAVGLVHLIAGSPEYQLI